MADIGVETTLDFIEELKEDERVKGIHEVSELQPIIVDKMFELYLKNEIVNANLTVNKDGLSVYLFVGVNGVGKTTTIAKIAYRLKKEGKKILLAAGDTFRAGAIDQLAEWARRLGVDIVTKDAGSDPSSVIYDALIKAKNESAKFWLSVMNGLKNRGLQDILIACVDGLTGFPAAIEAVYPKTEIQQCIIHQIRNTTKFVSYKDIKALMADLKKVYAAIDEQTALSELETFDEKWGNKYPKIAISWRDNWANLSTYFKYPQEVRTLIYTTNAIEGFNRQLRKVTKNKGVFPTVDSLLKMLYLAMIDITKKWTGRRQDWSMIHAQMAVYFEDRMSD